MAGQIFNGNINATATAWMMISMLLLCCSWEAFTGWLEKRCEENKANKEMLSKVFKELVILGFIAFVLIMSKELDILHFNDSTLHAFEFCDLLVSICVLIYILNCAISSKTMAVTQREWDRISMVDTAAVVNRATKALEKGRSVWQRCRLPGADKWRREPEFKILQLIFETKFHMPLHFDYVAYIKLVLQNIVVSMANISLYHWALICLINGVWWLAVETVLPWCDMTVISDEDICLFQGKDECGKTNRRRRRLASAEPATCRQLDGAAGTDGRSECRLQLLGDECQPERGTINLATELGRLNLTAAPVDTWTDCTEQPRPDIDKHETMLWLMVYIAIGWLVLLLCLLVLRNIDGRMRRLLAYNGAKDDGQLADLLKRLQMVKNAQQLERQAAITEQAGGDGDGDGSGGLGKPLAAEDQEPEVDEERDEVNETVSMRHSKSMHSHLVPPGGLGVLSTPRSSAKEEADHIMVFTDVKKNSNDVLSIRSFERLIFIFITFQLFIDFYFGFWLVHMRLRVSKAFGAEYFSKKYVMPQLLCHFAMLLPVLFTAYSLMVTVRKIALLVGVLHLNEDCVSKVHQHMERVKNVRRRIQETLAITMPVMHSSPEPDVAMKILAKAKGGELAILKLLDDRQAKDQKRITAKEIQEMLSAHAEHLFSPTAMQADATAFLDRKAFRNLQLMDPQRQATVQTARTLQLATATAEAEAEHWADSVSVEDFAGFVVRYVSDVMDAARSHQQRREEQARTHAFRRSVERLSCVTTRMLRSAQRLTRAKALFVKTDVDHSGSISQSELYRALMQYKVPISKREYREVFRVIDPDQSHQLKLDEWIDFMAASDLGLDMQTTLANRVHDKAHASWMKLRVARRLGELSVRRGVQVGPEPDQQQQAEVPNDTKLDP